MNEHQVVIRNYYDKVDGNEYRKIIMVIHNHKSLRVSCEDVRDFFKPRVLHEAKWGENWTIREIVFVQYFYPTPDFTEHFGLPQQIGECA